MEAHPLNVLVVSSEAIPYAKTGGLADVVGSLTRELARLGHSLRLVIPRYSTIDGVAHGFKEWKSLIVPTAIGPMRATIEQAMLPDSGVPVLAVRCDPYFARAGLYQQDGSDYPDNLERFAFFCRTVMELIPVLQRETGWVPDVLHAHDWQAALCTVYPRTLYAGHVAIKRMGTLFTIHNIGYQGLFPAADFWKTGLGLDLFAPTALEFHGSLNLLKGGLVFADLLTTVSPTYSQEIQTSSLGFGLEGVLRERRDRLVGVVNGIDVDLWNPAADPYLPSRYSASDLSGKQACKAALQQELKLPVRNVPLLGIVSRLAAQKGLDLVAEIMPELVTLDVQVALLGTGEPALEGLFRLLHAQYPEKLGLRIGFDEGLAHRIEAGSDLFLMPSRYEPCGLTQLVSLRYGAVPIVRRTGGLADTIVPYRPRTIREGRATGFMFGEPAGDALLSTILLALRVYADQKEWTSLVRAGMSTDVSWARSARSYADLYRRVGKLRAGPEL
jgi:starch synthase